MGLEGEEATNEWKDNGMNTQINTGTPHRMNAQNRIKTKHVLNKVKDSIQKRPTCRSSYKNLEIDRNHMPMVDFRNKDFVHWMLILMSQLCAHNLLITDNNKKLPGLNNECNTLDLRLTLYILYIVI